MDRVLVTLFLLLLLARRRLKVTRLSISTLILTIGAIYLSVASAQMVSAETIHPSNHTPDNFIPITVTSAEDAFWAGGSNTQCRTLLAGNPCTLRAAIGLANHYSAEDYRVTFDIPGSAPHVIQFTDTLGPLPAITASNLWLFASETVLDCTEDVRDIVLDGAALTGSGDDGFSVAGDGVVVKGFSIINFPDDGIVVTGNNNRVECNNIGLSADGMSAQGNGGHGIHVWGDSNTLGSGNFRNVIGANADYGVMFEHNADSNTVKAHIGVGSDGQTPIPNTNGGVEILGNSNGFSSASVISGHAGHGVEVYGDGNAVSGFIGMGADGDSAVPNGGNGVHIYNGADNNSVGGYVSANVGHGIYIAGDGNTVDATIGGGEGESFTNPTNANDYGNGGSGIYIVGDSNTVEESWIVFNDDYGVYISGRTNDVISSTIGTRITAFLINVTAGNGRDGIRIDGETADLNEIIASNISLNAHNGVIIIDGGSNELRGNLIGGSTGSSSNGNSLAGVHIIGAAAQGNRIGNDMPEDGNTISHNGESGVLLAGGTQGRHRVESNEINSNGEHGVHIIGKESRAEESTDDNRLRFNTIRLNDGNGIRITGESVGNQMSQNLVSDNTGLNIDLDGDEITLNDFQDLDIGANGLQNYPDLTVAYYDGGIEGTVHSTPSADFLVELYWSTDIGCTKREARTFIASGPVTTDANGNGSFTIFADAPINTGYTHITALLINQMPFSDAFYNTSELSPCVPLTYRDYVVNSDRDHSDADLTDGVCETASANECTLRAAIEQRNGLPTSTEAFSIPIYFDIPGSTLKTISPASSLPSISKRTSLSGLSQPGSSCSRLGIALDGNNAGSASGLQFNGQSAGSTLNGIAIGGFDFNGVEFQTDDNQMNCVNVGVNADATGTNSNGGHGVIVAGDNNVIGHGGTSLGLANHIGGNGGNGILLSNANSNVRNNYIGTNSAGDELSNGGSGIVYTGSDSAGEIENVVIGFNQAYGLVIEDNAGSVNLLSGYIGTDSNSERLPNGEGGILFKTGGSGTVGDTSVIGGFDYLAIDNNLGPGVTVLDELTTDIYIWPNSLFNNTIPIDLGDDGHTANDAGDEDEGPNNLQNSPKLTSITRNGDQFTIVGNYDSDPALSHSLTFYLTDSCLPDSEGQGRYRINSQESVTPGSTPFNIVLTDDDAPAYGYMTAIARGGSSTSEFSPCVPITVSAPTSVAVGHQATVGKYQVDALLVLSLVACSVLAVSRRLRRAI